MVEIRRQTTLIGTKVPVPNSPDEAVLETFPKPENLEVVELQTNEFTSICPFTGQPDWATIYIKYRPDKYCVETKSLKLYLQSYRNFKGTIESISSKICGDLFQAIEPFKIEVLVESTPRGGISVKGYSTKHFNMVVG